jgi:hypothetical protein
MKSQKTNWWLDAVLFAAFLSTFFLNITGVEIHQWIGIGIGIMLLAHLVMHIDWVGCVITRFFGKCTASSRVNLIIDMLLMGGFAMIIFTGLIISTWLNLAFIDYSAWWTVHVVSAVTSLFALLVKLFLHRKWIVNVAETRVFNRKVISQPAAVPVPAAARVNRREFLKMSAVLGAGAFVGVAQIHNVLERAVVSQAANVTSAVTNQSLPVDQNISLVAENPTEVPTIESVAVPTAVPTPASTAAGQNSSVTCSVRCPRGCSFPGRCRRYTDSNGNGKCDLGECL